MKKSILFIFIALISNISMTHSRPIIMNEVKQNKADYPGQVTRHFSRLKSDMNVLSEEIRTINFPTQVVRLESFSPDPGLSCDEIFKGIDEILYKNLLDHDIAYNFSYSCGTRDDKTYYYALYGYFDPLTDKAIAYLENYIPAYNGTDLYGAPLRFESAKGIVTTINISLVGIKQLKKSKHYRFNNTLYFDTAYDMERLYIDIGEKLLVHNSELITSFALQWMGMKHENEVSYFLSSFKRSNEITVWNRLVFLLDTEPKAYAMPAIIMYGYDCRKFSNERCL